MAFLAPVAAWLGSSAGLATTVLASTAITAGSQIAAGRAEAKMAESEAEQFERNAKATLAEGTRRVAEHLRQGQIAQSNMRAQMAGSGGVTDDPGAIQTLGEAGRVTKYNALASIYSTQSEAQGQRFAASNRRTEGSNAKRAGYVRSLGTVISGAGAYSKAMYPNVASVAKKDYYIPGVTGSR